MELVVARPSSRNCAGVRWKFVESAAFDVGNPYDARRLAIAEPRHVIVTQFILDRLLR